MPVRNYYLICRRADGTMRTVIAQSHRGAMRKFVAEYGPNTGEVYSVKERGGGDDWEHYSISRSGVRRIGKNLLG